MSRPIVRCQEMSQITPTMTLVEANATAQRNHGIAAWAVAAVAALDRCAGTGRAIVVMSGTPD